MNCKVCAYKLSYQPWGQDGKSPTFNFCPCCGVEFGYQDSSPEGIIKYRAEWKEKGYPWFFDSAKPDNWSLEEQLSFPFNIS